MTKRWAARGYDLSLPVIIRVPVERLVDAQYGRPSDISTPRFVFRYRARY
ncbi:MAG: hypothetical protein ACRD51_17770 [Candidatus Acidiferrum sp.]